ncbi:MAG TPA: NADPH-dependent F420 reductase [Conexivisphaerales archaeon]|nr:NADPH-dependent F420 reductase [Conexivisphaerales archaeon]
MKIAVFGGTGDLGRGLALRLAKRNDVMVGSREEGRAKEVASELSRLASGRPGALLAGSITGAANADAVSSCDLAVFAVPADTLEGFLEVARGFPWRDQLVLSPVTRFEKEGGAFVYRPYLSREKTLSAAELVQESLGAGARVVSGLHCVPASRLKDMEDPLGFDVPLAGPRESAAAVAQVLEGVEGLRPLYAGPLGVSASIEALTPLLLNLAIRNKIKDPGFRVVG